MEKHFTKTPVTFEVRGRGSENDKHYSTDLIWMNSKSTELAFIHRLLSFLTTYIVVPFDYVVIIKVQYKIQ